MEQAKAEMLINDSKLEKMQNMINYVQITMREKFIEGSNIQPLMTKRSTSQISMTGTNKKWRQHRNIQVLHDDN